MEPNATAIDSAVYHDVFSTSAMRKTWVGRHTHSALFNADKAPSLTQGQLK